MDKTIKVMLTPEQTKTLAPIAAKVTGAADADEPGMVIAQILGNRSDLRNPGPYELTWAEVVFVDRETALQLIAVIKKAKQRAVTP